jgi:hypothetical protein
MAKEKVRVSVENSNGSAANKKSKNSLHDGEQDGAKRTAPQFQRRRLR